MLWFSNNRVKMFEDDEDTKLLEEAYAQVSKKYHKKQKAIYRREKLKNMIKFLLNFFRHKNETC